MPEYIPTKGPLPGEQWIPSNSTEGYSFIEAWCTDCARDKSMREGAPIEDCDDNECCPVLAASFSGDAVEWRTIDGEQKCIAFVPAGQPIPAPRDELTGDLFGGDDEQSNEAKA